MVRDVFSLESTRSAKELTAVAHTPASRMVRGLGIQTENPAATVMPPDTKGHLMGLLSALLLFFFLRLPYGQYGPVSQLSRSEESCTGPFNWGEAHCAGEKVKRKIGPFLWKSLKNQTRTRTQQKGRSPPRQPGTPRPGSQVHGPKRKTTTTNKRLHKQILVRLNVLDLQWTFL